MEDNKEIFYGYMTQLDPVLQVISAGKIYDFMMQDDNTGKFMRSYDSSFTIDLFQKFCRKYADKDPFSEPPSLPRMEYVSLHDLWHFVIHNTPHGINIPKHVIGKFLCRFIDFRVGSKPILKAVDSLGGNSYIGIPHIVCDPSDAEELDFVKYIGKIYPNHASFYRKFGNALEPFKTYDDKDLAFEFKNTMIEEKNTENP